MRLALPVGIALTLSGCLTDAGTGTTAIIGRPFQNEPTGFRNIEWGARLNSISDKMTSIGKEKNVEMYVRPSDKLNFGDAQLASIHYSFYKGQLEGVFIKSKSGAMPAMVNTFQTQFGRGRKPTSIYRTIYGKARTQQFFLIATKLL